MAIGDRAEYRGHGIVCEAYLPRRRLYVQSCPHEGSIQPTLACTLAEAQRQIDSHIDGWAVGRGGRFRCCAHTAMLDAEYVPGYTGHQVLAAIRANEAE